MNEQELRYQCNTCTAQHDTLREAHDCYRSHTMKEAVSTVAGDVNDRNLVALVERHIDVASEREERRLRIYMERRITQLMISL